MFPTYKKSIVFRFQECFEALLKLLEWSWNTFHSIAREVDTSKGGNHLGAMTDLKKLVYISRACLRLLKIYVTEIYPDGGKRKQIEFYRPAHMIFVLSHSMDSDCSDKSVQ